MAMDPVKVHLNQNNQKHSFSQQHVSSQSKSVFILTVKETGLLTIQVSRMLLPIITGSSAHRGGGDPSRVERGGRAGEW